MRSCTTCGNNHLQLNSPVCGTCRRAGSKHECPVHGCLTMINEHATTCMIHRPRAKASDAVSCVECGDMIVGSSRPAACKNCRVTAMALCECNCGKYRKKYNVYGRRAEYISGHNDNWKDARRPLVTCAACGTPFVSSTTRQKLCGITCRSTWFKINPPRERKKVLVGCDVCGASIYRMPIKTGHACSDRCRNILVGSKLRGRISQPKKLALRRDRGRCRECGFDVMVEVHHIHQRQHGGDDNLDNLITLCPNHHSMADRGLLPMDHLRGLLAATKRESA